MAEQKLPTQISVRPVAKSAPEYGFQIPDHSGEFEWTATVINLNHPDNRTFLEKCRPLYEYTMLVRTIQTYQKSMPVADAVEKAVNECSKEGVLADFLKSHRSEVLRMYLAETDEQRIIFSLYKEGFQEGHNEGLREGFQNGHNEGLREGFQNGHNEGLREGFQEGHNEGLTEGRMEGQSELLSLLVARKFAKEKTLEQIAEELEYDVETIRPIYEQLIKEQR